VSETKKSIEKKIESRRRALLVALLGAGAPISQKLIPDTWKTPVVNSIVLTAHATTSSPTGIFGPSEDSSSNSNASMFENIAGRTEAEILDLFVNAAEAADSCPTNTCDTAGTVEVDVVATITQNPSLVECLQARVSISGSSCSSACLMYSFDAIVDGSTVTVAEDCELALTNVQIVNGVLQGDWNYTSPPLIRVGTFSSVGGSGGCGSLGCG